MNAADLLDGTLYGLAGVAYVASGLAVGQRRARDARLLAVAGTALLAAECALTGAWAGAAWNAVLLAVLLAWDWWNRRGRKVAKAIGERGRAVIAGLLEKVRDAGSPVPEGVRA